MATRFAGRFTSANTSNSSKEAVPVYERQWVLPTPTSRIKILKWVKTTKTRNFPETEDARYVYATSTGQTDTSATMDPLASTSTNTSAATAAVGATAGQQPSTGGSAAPAAGAGADVIMTDASGQPVTASVAEGEDIMDSGADETQGQHLFDETHAADLTMGADETQLDADMSIAGGGTESRIDTAVTSGQETPAEGEKASVLPTTTTTTDAVRASGEADEAEEEEESEAVVDDKYTTIRIGGPIPGEEPALEPEEVTASAEGNETEETTEPTPQVDSELHPPPDGVPPANPLATSSEAVTDEPTAATAPSADEIEREPAEGVDQDQEGDNLGGVTTISKDDPEVKGLGDEVAAVVHAQPDGVEQVKVVED